MDVGNDRSLPRTWASQLVVVAAAVKGCTDSAASNYNTAANTDDGSCEAGGHCPRLYDTALITCPKAPSCCITTTNSE